MRNQILAIVVIVTACCLALLSPAFGQNSPPKPTPEQIDKLIKTNLGDTRALAGRGMDFRYNVIPVG
jgi:hypothetical protein